MPAPTPRIGAMSLAGEDLLPRALRAHREGKLVMADKLYRRILEITPGDVSASQLLGVVRAQQRRFTEAEPLLLRAATADPANADAQNNLGNVLLELGRRRGCRAIPPGDRLRRSSRRPLQSRQCAPAGGPARRRHTAYRRRSTTAELSRRDVQSRRSAARDPAGAAAIEFWNAPVAPSARRRGPRPARHRAAPGGPYGRGPDAFRSRAGLNPRSWPGPITAGSDW